MKLDYPLVSYIFCSFHVQRKCRKTLQLRILWTTLWKQYPKAFINKILVPFLRRKYPILSLPSLIVFLVVSSLCIRFWVVESVSFVLFSLLCFDPCICPFNLMNNQSWFALSLARKGSRWCLAMAKQENFGKCFSWCYCYLGDVWMAELQFSVPCLLFYGCGSTRSVSLVKCFWSHEQVKFRSFILSRFYVL